MKKACSVVLSILLVTLLLSEWAMAEPPVARVALNQVQQEGNRLNMYLSMTDAAGSPCSGAWQPEDFQLKMDDHYFGISSVQQYDPQKQAIHYILCVDISGSIKEKMMTTIREGLHQFADTLGENDSVSLLTFGNEVITRLKCSRDRGEISAAIDNIPRTNQDTVLFRSVYDALQLSREVGGRSAIIVITDGKNDLNNGRFIKDEFTLNLTKETVFGIVVEAQVPIYSVGLNDANGVDTQSLEDFAEVSGGRQFIITTEDIPDTIHTISQTLKNTVQVQAEVENVDGREGFDSSTLQVAYSPQNGGMILSNELQQHIDWRSIPVPVVSSAPVLPAIALSVDQKEINAQGEVTITGKIQVTQGILPDAQEHLTLFVSDSTGSTPWECEISPNGTDYVFQARGSLQTQDNTARIMVTSSQADVNAYVIVSVVHPVAATPTPAPELTLQLEEGLEDQLLLPGQSVVLRGEVTFSGTVGAEDILLLVNDTPYDQENGVDFSQISNQSYAFSLPLPMDTAAVSISACFRNTDIVSRSRRITFATPAPTARPQILLTLSNDQIPLSEEGALLSGSIRVEGSVTEEDLVLYISDRECPMELTPGSQGRYQFRAVVADIASAERILVYVALRTDGSICSDDLYFTILAPVAEETPIPRSIMTPSPTEVVTAAPTQSAESLSADAEDTASVGFLRSPVMRVAIPLALLLILAAVIIVAVLLRKRNREIIVSDEMSGFDTRVRDGADSPATVRGGDDPEATVMGSSDTVDEIPRGAAGMERYGSYGHTVALEVNPAAQQRPTEGGGTVRLMDGEDSLDAYSGTERIEENVICLPLRIEEHRGNVIQKEHSLRLQADDEIVIGRSQSADLTLEDGAVSSRHCKLAFDGENLFLVDMGSTNGTRCNESPLLPNQPQRLSDGSSISLGRTTLRIRFTA